MQSNHYMNTYGLRGHETLKYVFSARFSQIFPGISKDVSNFDGIDVAILKVPECFEKIPKFCRNILLYKK